MAGAGVANRVRFTGRVEPPRVWEHLHAADICVDPAPPGELNDRSTMVKVAEYLAAGKPVVAFALPETARTVGDAALLVKGGDPAEFADAIALLSEDHDQRRELAHRAVQRVRGLTWEHSARELLAAYERL